MNGCSSRDDAFSKGVVTDAKMCSTGGNFGNGTESASRNRFLVQGPAIALESCQARRDKVGHPTKNFDLRLRYSTLQPVLVEILAAAVAIQPVVVGNTVCSQSAMIGTILQGRVIAYYKL